MIRTMVVLLATGVAPQGDPAARLHDSVGIRIVENAAARTAKHAPFLVAAEPMLQIGREGSPEYRFNDIVQASRLSGGRILVADGGSAEIRIFDARGRLVETMGRRGAGPGEFGSLSAAWGMAGDSVRAWDASVRRLTTFAPGRRAATILGMHAGSTQPPGMVGLVRGVLSNGSFFGYRVGRAPIPRQTAVTRDTLVVERYGANGLRLGPVGSFLGLEVLEGRGGSMPGPDGTMRSTGFSRSGVPFARETRLRAGRNGLYVTAGDGESRIACYDSDGVLRRIVTTDRARRPVTAAVIRAHRAAPRGLDSPARPNVSPEVDERFYPRALPAYSGILLDAAERIWARHYAAPGDAGERWDVFDADGVLLGVVATPERFQTMEIGDGYVLGVWLDDLDVEYVRLYALSAQRSGGR